AGELTPAARTGVLEDACDDVVDAVLHDCALQSTALSRAKASSPRRMEALEALLAGLEGESVLDRAVEGLPDREEMSARGQAGAGLTRPELAVLLAGAKRSLTARLLVSSVPDQPALRPALVSYFPAAVARRFDHLLDRHRLARELIASVVANEVVNRMDATFVSRLSAEAGAPPAAVAAAYWVAREVVDGPAWWRRLDQAEARVPVPAAVAAAGALTALQEALTRDYLRGRQTDDIAATVARDGPAMAELAAAVATIGTPQRRRRRARRAEALVGQGFEPELAGPWACLEELEIGPDACDLARRTDRPIVGVADAIMRVGEALGIERLVERLGQATPEDRWAKAAWRGLLDDLDDLRRMAAERALDDHPADDAVDAVILFLAGRASLLGELTRLLRDIEAEPRARLDAVAVATRAVRRAIE
ncbi:MAG: NAD-glutamate dehydrogenase, partial [Actinobacteria bacterium]|nr:NAD-glutamate dehydrogenase [Actinomycetota bacterium]